MSTTTLPTQQVEFTLLSYRDDAANSNKFYAAYHDGTHTWLHWGKNGAPVGQAQVAEDPGASIYSGKIAEKLRKGYQLVRSGTRSDVPATVQEHAKAKGATSKPQQVTAEFDVAASLGAADELIEQLCTQPLTGVHGERFAGLTTKKEQLAAMLADLETRLEVASALMQRGA